MTASSSEARSRRFGAGLIAGVLLAGGLAVAPPARAAGPQPDSAGLLGDSDGGLGAGQWSGIDRARVAALVARLPVAAGSPSMRALALRLLLTRAVPPGGAGGGDLLAMRVEGAAALGDGADGWRLVRRAGGTPGPALAHAALDALLLSRTAAAACPDAQALPHDDADPAFQELAIVCRVAAGDRRAVVLGGDLLRDQGDRDAGFLAVSDAVAGTAPLTTLPDPTALDLALADAAKLALPADVLQAADPGTLIAIAHSASTEPAIRLAAAEQAAAGGGFDAAALAAAYQALTPAKPPADGPLARGGSYRALLAASSANDRAAAAHALVSTVPPATLAGPVGTLIASALADVPPTRALAGFAPDAALVYLAQGDAEIGQGWYQVASDNPEGSAAVARAAARLWPLAALAGAAPASDRAAMERWVAATPGPARATLNAQVALLAASGVMVDVAAWRSVAAAAGLPGIEPPHLSADLRTGLDTANPGHRGASVLAGLVALGDGGPAGAPVGVVALVVHALHRDGLDQAAAAIAREAILARIA